MTPPAAGGRRRAIEPEEFGPASGPHTGRQPAVEPLPTGGRRRADGGVQSPGVRRGATRVAALPDPGGAVVLALRALWGFAIVAYLGLAYEESAPYTAAVVTLVAVLLGAFAWLRWQHEAAAYRAELRGLDRPIAALIATGAVGILAVVPASMLGAIPAARIATIAAAAALSAAALLAGRRRAGT